MTNKIYNIFIQLEYSNIEQKGATPAVRGHRPAKIATVSKVVEIDTIQISIDYVEKLKNELILEAITQTNAQFLEATKHYKTTIE